MNLLKTINNLDKVLGHKSSQINNNDKVLGHKSSQIKPLKLNKVLGHKSSQIKPNDKLDYLSYADIVNGRCAIVGRFAAPIIYELTGQNLITQITVDPVDFSIKFIGTVGLISIISMLTFSQYDDKNIPEVIEDGIGKFFMINWLYIILFNIVK